MRAAVALAALALAVPRGAAAEESPRVDPVVQDILQGVRRALEGKHARAARAFSAAARAHPEPKRLDPVLGLHALLRGRSGEARRRLKGRPRWAAYLAMAEAGRPGGLARAKSAVARAAEGDAPDASALWFAALAFARVGQPERADALLQRAVKAAEHALSPKLAPEPGVALAEAALAAIEGLRPVQDVRVLLAEALLDSGRHGAAVAWAEDGDGARWARVRALGLRDGHPSSARSAIARWRRAAPSSVEARVVSAERAVAAGDEAGARAALGTTEDFGRFAARAHRVQAALRIAEKDGDGAFDAARAALRAEPKSHRGRALLVRALLLQDDVGRAAEVAEHLLKQRPTKVNPYALLVEVRTAQKRTRNLPALKLRAEGFDKDRARSRRRRAAIEKVFEGVRDAESGLGATGLTALREADARLSLPLDLALARRGGRGVARAARDRILAACAPKLKALLTLRGPAAETTIRRALYGSTKSAQVTLTAADPFRCGAGRIRVGR